VRRQQFTRNVLVWLLLTAVFALTSTPVCGSVLDIDPASCCSRHACQQPASTSGDQSSANFGQSEKACCPSTAVSSGCTAESCCNQGRLNYPSVKVQPVTSFAAGLHIVMTIPAALLLVPSSAARPAFLERPLKIPLRALYLLTTTFRI
jgi:hypothetical protein